MINGERLSRIEHEAWTDLVGDLKRSGAVTNADCNSNVQDNRTPGQKLFNKIRYWGERLVELNAKAGKA